MDSNPEANPAESHVAPSEKRARSVAQALGGYAVAAWIAYQVVLALYEGLGLPEWVPRYSLILLIIGLPMVAATALVQQRLEHARHLPASGGIMTRLLTWRRTVLGGVAAFALLAFITMGFVFVKKRNTLFAQGVMERDAPVIVADFSSRDPRDSLNAVAMTEAVRSALQDSKEIKLAAAPAVSAGLERMQRHARDGLPLGVATELAQREGYKAVITGSILPAGTGYLLTVDVLGPDSTSYARLTESVDGPSELIRGFKNISTALREKVGESVKTVRKSVPLAVATTSSLPALRKYSEALRIEGTTGDLRKATSLLEEAVAIDSTFASAWRKLAVTLNNAALRPSDARAALTRAYDLRDRLPDRERYLTIASYFSSVKLDRDAAIDALRQLVELDSDNASALNNLGLLLTRDRKYAEAETFLKQAAELNNPSAYTNYSIVLFQQGKIPEALAVMEKAERVLPDNGRIAANSATLRASAGDWKRADSIVTAAARKFSADKATQVALLSERSSIALMKGHLAEYERLLAEMERIAVDIGYSRLDTRLMSVTTTFYVRHDTAGAARELNAALKANPLSAVPRLDRPYAAVSYLHALVGQLDQARATLDSARAAQATESEIANVETISLLRQRNAVAALASLRKMDEHSECNGCDEPVRGEVYELLGKRDSAIAAYERYLSAPESRRVEYDPLFRVNTLIRLGELYEVAGNPRKAIERYSEVLQLWSDADPELRPRVEAIRRRVAALQAKNG